MNLRMNDMCTRTIAGYKISLYSVAFDLISNICVCLFSNLSAEAITAVALYYVVADI